MRVKSACDLAGFQKEPAIVAIGGHVRACGSRKEVSQAQIADEFWLVIDRLAKDLDRNATPERLLPGGGIHCDDAAGFIEQLRQLAAAYEMDAIRDAVLAGEFHRKAAHLHAAVL